MILKKSFDLLLNLYLPRYLTFKRLLAETFIISSIFLVLSLLLGVMLEPALLYSFSLFLTVIITFKLVDNSPNEEIKSFSKFLKVLIISTLLFCGFFGYESLIFYGYEYPMIAFSSPLFGAFYWYKIWNFDKSGDNKFYVNPHQNKKLWESASRSLILTTEHLNNQNSFRAIYHSKQASYKYDRLKKLYPSTVSENNIAKFYSNAASCLKKASLIGKSDMEAKREKVEEGLDWEEKAKKEAKYRTCDECKNNFRLGDMVWSSENGYHKAKFCRECYRRSKQKTNQRYKERKKKRERKKREHKNKRKQRQKKYEEYKKNKKQKNRTRNKNKEKQRRRKRKSRKRSNTSNNSRSKNDKSNNKNKSNNKSTNNEMTYEEALKILGCDKNSDEEEIKKAYREKAKEKHPDQGGSTEEVKKINKAYEIVK